VVEGRGTARESRAGRHCGVLLLLAFETAAFGGSDIGLILLMVLNVAREMTGTPEGPGAAIHGA